MPELKPFRGIRYSSAGELAELVCPPYDVISDFDHHRLNERHPHNAVRLELPASNGRNSKDYAAVRQTWDEWLAAGVLEVDTFEALYVLRQDFVDDHGVRRKVTGVIGALTLEPFGGTSSVLPHEVTMPGPVADRLSLLHACPVNISPIYSIYGGASGLSPYYESLLHRPPVARFQDERSTLQRLWAVTAPAEIAILTEAVGARPLVIADGHHRYETALAYHRERAGAPGGHDAVMCLCVDADSEDVMVLPYHRTIWDAPPREVRDTIVHTFGGRKLGPEVDPLDALRASESKHPFVFVLPEESLLAEISEEEAARLLAGRPPGLRDLHVVILHEAVLPALWPGHAPELGFSRDAAEVVDLVRRGTAPAGVLVKPLDPKQVVNAAITRARMPQKATYFWPKVLTGLVFRSLE
jgi:uncharacterized protein (DUF1015 family)